MRILLIAYDFPPIPSPQSLRWAYMVRALSEQGHEVDVLAPDVPGYGPGGLPAIPPEVRVHRVPPGPLTTLLAGRRRRELVAAMSAPARPAVASVAAPGASVELQEGAAVVPQAAPGHLNWKGRLAERMKRVVSWALFPDQRAEWLPWARRRMRVLLTELRPDVVVTSHEPACAIPLGIDAHRLGHVWVADLGDPVLAGYTPRRWRAKAFRLERAVCRDAALVSVTTDPTGELLADRHGLDAGRCLVLPQGFDATVATDGATVPVVFDSERLELLYTGSFYGFRRADALIEAVVRTPGCRLTIASALAPDSVRLAAERHPDQIRFVGFLPHTSALIAQRRADVLVNIANADPVQIPGKVYEYFGARRPVLHLHQGTPDATASLIESAGVGWGCSGEGDALVARLRELVQASGKGALLSAPRWESLDGYSWQVLAARWAERVQSLPRSGRMASE